MDHAGEDIRGNVMKTLYVSDRRDDPGGLPNKPNLAGVGLIHVHDSCKFNVRVDLAKVGGCAETLHRPPFAARDTEP
jgi:hypothetical protein